MKIAFIQEELYPYLSFMYLAAIAKNMKYKVEVFVDNGNKGFLESITGYRPDIICFSTTTANYSFTRKTAKRLKALMPSSFILVGGWHPTFYPEILEDETSFDALCLGEGEIPFKVFLEFFPDPKSMQGIPNFHIKINKKVYRNPLTNLIEDLDDIVFPERSIYYNKFGLLKNQLTKIFNAGRGCPYLCAYCFNERMKNIYNDKGRYVRFRSPENIVKEINLVRVEYPIRYVQFIDDTFNSDRKWLMSFLDFYQKEVHLPFIASCRIEKLDEEIIAKMKAAGADKVNFGIEHGNEQFREQVLGRNMKNSHIYEGSRLLKKYNIRFQISNMVGLPKETLDLAIETLKINQQVKPFFATMHVFQPYPGTRIYQAAKEQGYFDEDLIAGNISGHYNWGTDTTRPRSIIKIDNINQMLNLHSFFPFLVQHKHFLPIIKPLLNLAPNKYFEFFQTWYIFKFKIKYSATFKEKINYFLQLTKNILPATLQRLLERCLGFYKMI